ncbi:histidine kinase, partial [Cupriavidus sp. 2MCAB6]
VDTDLDDDGDELRALKLKPKLIEIYAPIYREKTRDIIAIGEFYEFSQFMNREISSVRYATWFLIANVAIVIVILLHVIVKRASRIISSQQALLEQNLARAEALAKRNNALRRAADRARLNATVLNETYLASIGADIHDGPIQLLSLMMLKLPSAADRASGTVAPAAHAHGELEPLIQQVLSDLRNLSSGLALPEAENLSLAETIH